MAAKALRIPLRNNLVHFPSFSQLPYDKDVNERYYALNFMRGVYTPSKHWIFLGEIYEDQTLRIPRHPGEKTMEFRGPRQFGIERPRYGVRDKNGQELQVAFHTDPAEMVVQFDARKFKIGHTIAVLYAHSHSWAFGGMGLRIEQMAVVKVIPCSLKALLDAHPKFPESENEECAACAKQTKTRCSKCKTPYCSRECQRRDWRERHKDECVAVRQLRNWASRTDWHVFGTKGYWDFRTTPNL
ncbi:hypothetical protein FISHEDRAFT_55080 [Fistulina hepatica ATCC 64428]|uniref:MYND-type domain-containing protein n=1 Tax=Fistulina hepatica ATCC 64428 TaxID=1128425 RepID=A0A0D7AP44_9AGAR|nr:hypothetical protein FISHEDRAFT_55080 [Fistulina hepatica ATCC 64428]